MKTAPDAGGKAPISWRQAGWLTAGAAALLLGLHLLPTRPGLSHMDFIAGGANALQFCDPENPSFLAVAARSSPVAMAVSAGAAEAGRPVGAILVLRTATGKPIGPADLAATASGRLQLLVVDPYLEDFQVTPARPGRQPGAWVLGFTPRAGGIYRIFADLTPVAIQREIYAFADLAVAPSSVRWLLDGRADAIEKAGEQRYQFHLEARTHPIYARQTAEFALTAAPVGDRAASPYLLDRTAHLAIFDEARSGLVHLHAQAEKISGVNQSRRQWLFRAAMANPGRYVAWCRIGLGGREIQTRLQLQVIP